MMDGMGSMSRRGGERKCWHRKTRSHIAPDQTPLPLLEPIQQGRWSNLPPELLLDIIRRVEESETSWPARKTVVCCASVCRSWRVITKEIVKTPEQCGRLTFPISLKQVMLFSCYSALFFLVKFAFCHPHLLFLCLWVAGPSRVSNPVLYQKGQSHFYIFSVLRSGALWVITFFFLIFQ